MSEADDIIRTSTTSSRTADAEPIVLRETGTTRLIFRPVLLDNPNNPEAAIDGEFIFERKSPKGTWVSVNELPLSKLKATEWVRLELRAAELLTLFRKLGDYYELVATHGLGYGRRDFVRAPKSEVLRALLGNADQLATTLSDKAMATSLMEGLLTWIAKNESAVVTATLDGISVSELQEFDAVLALARLDRFCHELDENASNADEGYWQDLFESYSWVIAQVFTIPLMIVRSQVYVGGKTLSKHWREYR